MDDRGNLLQLDDRPIGMLRLRVACASDSSQSIGSLVAAERRRDLVREERPGNLDAWRRLACARLILFARGARSRQGYGMALGDSWSDWALAVLVGLLEQWPHDTTALHQLAILSLETAEVAPPAAGHVRRKRPGDQRPQPAEQVPRIGLEGVRGPAIAYRACVALAIMGSTSGRLGQPTALLVGWSVPDVSLA